MRIREGFLPFMRWLPEWREPGVIRADLLAGLTGAVVVIPQGLAFAMLAGLPAHYGLYAAIIPCLLAALFGSSRQMVTGPANAISLTTMALVTPFALAGSDQYISLVLTMSFLVGVVQIMLGLGGVGRWIERVPHSVIVGFTVGAAVLIVNSQLGTLFGVSVPRGSSVAETIPTIIHAFMSNGANWVPMISVGVTLLTLWLWRPLNHRVPAMLVALLVGSAVAPGLELLFPLADPLARVGEIPSALPPLSFPDLSLDTLQMLFGPVMVMTLLASTEAMAIARAMAMRDHERHDANQEFIGQGLANIGGSFFSAYPASGSFNRSGLNRAAGARTPLSAASAAVFLVVILLLVSPLSRYLPYSVMAALLLAVAWGLISPNQIRREWRAGPGAWLPMVITAFATILISIEWAILLGLCSAMIASRLGQRA
jgi:sulfate permease, SulP family